MLQTATMKFNCHKLLMSGLVFGLLLSASCKSNDDNAIIPTKQPPSWGPSMQPEMMAVIEQLDSFHQAAVQDASPADARLLKGLSDAEDELARQLGIPTPTPLSSMTETMIPVNGTKLNVRIFRPNSGGAMMPAVLYLHGGGWVIGSSEMYAKSARSLADNAGVVVISLDYRLAPENKFPTAHEDALATYQWLLANAASFQINPSRIAVVGEDAGANMACNISIAARDNGWVMPRCQVLISPIVDPSMSRSSYTQFAAAEPLSKAQMAYYFSHYLRNSADATDTRINLLQANLQNLPPTTIVSAVIDPLDGDALALQNTLNGFGNSVTRTSFNGVTHDFFGLSKTVPEARDAQAMAVAALRAALY